MLMLNRLSSDEWETMDGIYRIQEQPDPWNDPPKGSSWLVSRATFSAWGHSTQRSFGSLLEAREWIDSDSQGPVFVEDRLGSSGRLACRWCDCFMDDVRDGLTGCRLCEAEVQIIRETNLAVCADPSCGRIGFCSDECSCPRCSSLTDRRWKVESIAAWDALAPMMRALNAEDVTWLWGTKSHGDDRKPDHSLEIEYDDKFVISIDRYNDVFHADLHTEIRRATRIEPAEWGCVDSTASESVESIVSWVCQTISQTLEGVS